MSAWDEAEWATFEEAFGPLTLHERIDAAAAHIAYAVHASAGGKLPPEQFVIRWGKPKRWTDDQIVSWLDAMAKKGQA
jgi:hypothetical protein